MLKNKLKTNKILLLFVLVTVIALVVRFLLFNHVSGDYDLFLKDWFDFFRENGIKGLANYPGDYNAPYMTILALLSYIPINSLFLIKIVSIIFDFVLAIMVVKIFKEIKPDHKKELDVLLYFVCLMLPQFVLNSACWGQCDSIYASFVMISILFLLRKKYTKSFLFLGIAFAFKLQTVLILPLYIILFFSTKKINIFNFFLIPLMNIVLSVPALLMGKPFNELILVYFNQTGTYSKSLVLNFVNIYHFINSNVSLFYKLGFIFTVLLFLIIMIYIIKNNKNWTKEKIITLALLSVVIATFFLPGMHDRYLYVGEVLSILYYFAYKKNLLLVLIININALITYTCYLCGITMNSVFSLSFVIYMIAIIIFIKNFIFLFKKDQA